MEGEEPVDPQGRKNPAEREETGLGGEIEEGELIGNKAKIRARGRP